MKRRHASLAGVLLLLLGCAEDGAVQFQFAEGAVLRSTVLRNDLVQPWGMAILPGDSEALVTEKAGRLVRVNLDAGGPLIAVDGVPAVDVIGQGGLLDVALDPDFPESPYVYLSYAKADAAGRAGTEVGRGKLVGDRLENWQTLLVATPKLSGGQHFGSRLVFDRAGHLFITLGDRGLRDEAQNPASHVGSILRIHRDGSIPADNPWVNTPGYLPELYSIGHRNVQGAALNPWTGELWAHEHGPQGGDEVNIIRAGRNYGWPTISWGGEYGSGEPVGEGTAKPGLEQPELYWTPSIAPSGMAFYAADHIAAWRDTLLVGALKYTMLVRLSLDGGVVEEERLYKDQFGRIRNVETDGRGRVFLLTDSSEGQLVRIESSTASTP